MALLFPLERNTILHPPVGEKEFQSSYEWKLYILS